MYKIATCILQAWRAFFENANYADGLKGSKCIDFSALLMVYASRTRGAVLCPWYTMYTCTVQARSKKAACSA